MRKEREPYLTVETLKLLTSFYDMAAAVAVVAVVDLCAFHPANNDDVRSRLFSIL